MKNVLGFLGCVIGRFVVVIVLKRVMNNGDGCVEIIGSFFLGKKNYE